MSEQAPRKAGFQAQRGEIAMCAQGRGQMNLQEIPRGFGMAEEFLEQRVMRRGRSGHGFWSRGKDGIMPVYHAFCNYGAKTVGYRRAPREARLDCGVMRTQCRYFGFWKSGFRQSFPAEFILKELQAKASRVCFSPSHFARSGG
jgi:hypothetical protein